MMSANIKGSVHPECSITFSHLLQGVPIYDKALRFLPLGPLKSIQAKGGEYNLITGTKIKEKNEKKRILFPETMLLLFGLTHKPDGKMVPLKCQQA